MASCRVLIVEDEIADSTLLQRAFSKSASDVDVDVVEDGYDAISFLIPDNDDIVPPKPDFIVLDLKLRRMDGHEVLHRLKTSNLTQKIPIVVFSSSSDPVDIQRAYDLGANSYIVKPVRSSELTYVAKSLHDYWCKVNCMKGVYNDR
ncbi:response regulator [Thalassospiraceae bacterium LMO-JJ14]|nr:response regulator [Thalassospiraceae bacterium LMO-JJ14]